MKRVVGLSRHCLRRVILDDRPSSSLVHYRYASSDPSKGQKKAGFFKQLVDQISEEADKNKQLQENLSKLRQETKKMEDSDALKQARRKFEVVQKETLNSSEILKQKIDDLQLNLKKVVEDARNTPQGQKIVEMGEEMLKQTKNAAETLGKQHENISSTQAYQSISSRVQAVAMEIDDITINNATLYRTPDTLKMRSEHSIHTSAAPIEPNLEAMGMTLHRDSQWYQNWKNWKDNSPYLNKILDWKIQMDESEHPAARIGRFVTGKVASVFAPSSELSAVLTEIASADPNFTLEEFQSYMEKVMVPNVLEAVARQDFDILKDWCHERAYSQLSHPIVEGTKLGYVYISKIIDIGRSEVLLGKMTEQGPVLIVSFPVQSIEAMVTSDGKVVEGDKDAAMRTTHTWVVCRDMQQLDPKVAWKLLEYMRQNPQKMMF